MTAARSTAKARNIVSVYQYRTRIEYETVNPFVFMVLALQGLCEQIGRFFFCKTDELFLVFQIGGLCVTNLTFKSLANNYHNLRS